MALVNEVWLIAQLPLLAMQPYGMYGISYDIYTNPTERPVPAGWQSPRARTYRELIRLLVKENAYQQHQYSDYRKRNITATAAFLVAIGLTSIRPPSKLSTTVRELKIHYISDINLLDVTQEVMLGGNAAQRLAGPAPRGLVQGLVGPGLHLSQIPQPVPQGQPGVPPFATKRTLVTQDVNNYVM